MSLSASLLCPTFPHVHNDLAAVNETLAGQDVHFLIMISSWPGAVHPSISLSLVSHHCSHNFISLFPTPSVVLLIRLVI